jgi:integrase
MTNVNEKNSLLIINNQNQVKETEIARENQLLPVLREIQGVSDDLQRLHKDVDKNFELQQKKLNSIEKNTQPKVKLKKIKPNRQRLRQGIGLKEYKILMEGAGSNIIREKNLRRIQLRLIYTILFYLGLRLNEARLLNYLDFQQMIEQGNLNVLQHKTGVSSIRTLPPSGQEALRKLQNEVHTFFITFNCHALGTSKFLKNNPTIFSETNFLRFVNQDIFASLDDEDLRSHSFRIGWICRLLKHESIHKVQKMIGHASIVSTSKYFRWEIDVEKTKQQLEKAFQNDD